MNKRMNRQEEDEILPEQVIIVKNQNDKKLYRGTLRELCHGYMNVGFVADHLELIYTINNREAVISSVDNAGVRL